MSKSVLISIRPEWVELIVSGKKTIEVRKSRPKLEPPFKCYIYCTKGKDLWLAGVIRKREAVKLNMKVVGEFICDQIIDWHYVPDLDESADPGSMSYDVLTVDGEKTGMEYDDFEDYGKGRPLYGWHISDLKIYDVPRKIGDFSGTREPYLKRPPQSYCFVEDIAT